MDLRVVLFLAFLGNITVRQLRVNSEKNIQRFRVNKVSAVIKIFNRPKIRPLPSERSHHIIWHGAEPLSNGTHKQIKRDKSFMLSK